MQNLSQILGYLSNTIISHFTFYAIFNIKKYIEKCPFTYWLNWRWFLQIVERDSWNLYPLFPYSDFVSQIWGGGCNVFLTFYAISKFFFVCWKYCIVPLHLQLLVKWEVVSPNSRYREFYHEIGNIMKSAPSLTG